MTTSGRKQDSYLDTVSDAMPSVRAAQDQYLKAVGKSQEVFVAARAGARPAGRVHKAGTVTVVGQKFRLGTDCRAAAHGAGRRRAVPRLPRRVVLKTVPRTTCNDVVRFGPRRPPRQRAYRSSMNGSRTSSMPET
jgi:hypothetical protein